MSSKSRKRRRVICDKCGNGFCHAWYKKHRNQCGRVENVQNSSPNSVEANFNTNGDADQPIGLHQEIDSNAHEELNEVQPLSSTRVAESIASEYADLLNERRSEEDMVFFDESCDLERERNEILNEPVQPPPTEFWDNSEDDLDIDKDFDLPSSEEKDNSHECNSRLKLKYCG